MCDVRHQAEVAASTVPVSLSETHNSHKNSAFRTEARVFGVYQLDGMYPYLT